MSLLKKLFSDKVQTITSYHDFWKWFQQHEQNFSKAVRSGDNIEHDFFNKLAPQLAQLKEGIYYLCGMANDQTVELIFSAEGIVKNIAAVEELVEIAPDIAGWMFTALKPSLPIDAVSIEMSGYRFHADNIWFQANNFAEFPDEIDITVIYDDWSENDKELITHGVYIFLDNFLGELNFAITIDNLTVAPRNNGNGNPIPVEKLKGYLIWRQTEFVEKYEATRYNTENDRHSGFEAKMQNGDAVLAVINTDLLMWEGKASHPWIVKIEITYTDQNNSGLPDKETFDTLNKIDEELIAELKDHDGYLYIGRETGNATRTTFFACKEFRKPSKITDELTFKYASILPVTYNIYKDKYWQTFDRFMQV